MYVRTEYVAPDVIPVQYGIGRIAQPFPGYGEIVKVLQVSLYRLPHEIGSATVELPGGSIQLPHKVVRQPCGNLVAHGSLLPPEAYQIRLAL